MNRRRLSRIADGAAAGNGLVFTARELGDQDTQPGAAAASNSGAWAQQSAPDRAEFAVIRLAV